MEEELSANIKKLHSARRKQKRLKDSYKHQRDYKERKATPYKREKITLKDLEYEE